MKKKLHPSSMPAPRKQRAKGAKRHDLLISRAGEMHDAWPSLQQLREGLHCRVGSEPECPYRFDQSL